MNKIAAVFLMILSPSLACSQILLHDSFNDNSLKWYVGQSDESEFRIDSGYYHIESAGTVESQPLDSVITKAFFASTSARITKGTSKAAFGFFLQTFDSTADRKLFFLVNPAGFYSCFMQKPDGTYPLSRWTPSPYLLKGEEWNTKTFTGDSAKINLYINDFYIRSFDNPFFHYNYAGVASFDSSTTDFNEIFVFAYPKLEKFFDIDFYHLPDVLNFILKEYGEKFKRIRGEERESVDKTKKLYDAKLWIPGAKEVFISAETYSAVFGSYLTADDAVKAVSKLRDKILLALPGYEMQEGHDEEELYYVSIGKMKDAKLQHPLLDLYITHQADKEGKSVYSVALDIE
jgi:hypothetical protein